VLIIAIKQSSRPIFVPMFAILVATLIFGGVLQKMEPETFPDVFDSMFAIFWLVLTLGYDGTLGTAMLTGKDVRFESRFLIAAALICGVILTTMPITIIGNSFAAAWEKKEVIPNPSPEPNPNTNPIPIPNTNPNPNPLAGDRGRHGRTGVPAGARPQAARCRERLQGTYPTQTLTLTLDPTLTPALTPTLNVLKEFDPDGSGTLDWEEFYGAMQVRG